MDLNPAFLISPNYPILTFVLIALEPVILKKYNQIHTAE